MILITGGLGFIGSHLALSLLKQGKEIIIVDNLVNSNIHMLERLQQISGHTIPFFDSDLRNTPALNKFIEQYVVDLVIHCAGFKSVSESHLKPVEYYNNNLSSSISLIRAMQRAGIRKIIFLSSVMVYGSSGTEFTEETSLNYISNNPYLKSQQMIETMFKDLITTDVEWQVMILRLSNVAGAFQEGFLGEFIPPVPKTILGLLLQVANHERTHIDLYENEITSDGSDERSFIHILDVCDAVISAIHWLYTNKPHHTFEVFNITHPQIYSILELIEHVKNTLQVDIPIVKHPYEANHYHGLERVNGSIQRATQILDWTPHRGIGDIIQHQWAFYTT